jgi:hypothetical protein
MDATKPYKSIGFGVMDATKPYKSIGFGAMDATNATKPYKSIGFGASDGQNSQKSATYKVLRGLPAGRVCQSIGGRRIGV